jgi:methylmalonyl-CoA mutase C-terminal domain/subunit
MEVIYTGLHRSPDQIAEAALQEDAQVIGLSVLSGAHGTLVPKIVAALATRGLDDVLIVVGGIIPESDIQDLESSGVAKVFGPGSRVEDIVTYVRTHAPSR